MKKKFLSLILSVSMVIACFFALTACSGEECDHKWKVVRVPTANSTGATACTECGEIGFEMPKFNETDYTVTGSNPDYKIYTYTKDGESYEFGFSNFQVERNPGSNEYRITGYTGNSANIVIPETIVDIDGELPVVEISDEVFKDKTNLVSVTLPAGIKEINNGTFSGCTNLSSINLPDGLQTIGSYAFAQTALTQVVIPDSVTRIGTSAFENCADLQKISIPFVGDSANSVVRFGSIFGDVNTNDSIPESLKEVYITGNSDICNYAFNGAANIEKIVIDGNVSKVGQYAFANCSSLTTVVFNDNLVNIEGCAFENCSLLEEIVIPDSVTSIGNAAFYQCNNLKTVYYMGDKTQWNNISIGAYNDNNSKLNNANRYYYSEIQPTAVDYLNNNKVVNTWHYVNDEKVLWQINLTNNVDNKTFAYSSSVVDLSDEYWAMLSEAKNQNMLESLFDNDQQQIEMVTGSANKAEYESKLATYYASVATTLTVSFADGKATLQQSADFVTIDYIEVDNEIYYTLTKTMAFAFDNTDNTLYEQMSSDYFTVKHIYSLAE